MNDFPCIKGRCFSPVACGGFGYCRELNFDPMLDSYLSWEAAIAELRRRWLAGEAISPGPWYKPPRETDEESAA